MPGALSTRQIGTGTKAISIMGDCKLEFVHREDVSEASMVIARAFADSPSYVYILQDKSKDERIKALHFLFVKNLGLVLDRCPEAARCVRQNGNIVAVFFWTPKAHEKVDLWTMIRYGGALELPFRLGWSGLKRLLATIEEFEQAWKDIWMKDEDCWTYLERMTVLPEHQGNGIGTAALRQALAETSGYVRLATQEERNIRFYKRLGFEVIGERDLGEGDYKYKSWFLCTSKKCPM